MARYEIPILAAKCWIAETRSSHNNPRARESRANAPATDFLPSGVDPLLLTRLTASNKPGSRFVQERLPWLIGGGGLLVYLVTLNHWISLSSLGTVARTAGWLWQAEIGRPLTLAVLSPFRLLPDSWLPLALNLF